MTTSSEKGTTPSENGTFASKNWKVVGTKEGVRADGSSSLTLCIHRVRESEAKKRKKMELEAEQSQKKKRKRGKFLALAKGMETRMFLEPPASLLARAATQCLPNCAVAQGRSTRRNCATRHTDRRDLCVSGTTCPIAVDGASDRGAAIPSLSQKKNTMPRLRRHLLTHLLFACLRRLVT